MRRFNVPCIPDTGLGLPPIVDMGAFEFNAHVSGVPADFDGDCDLDSGDVSAFIACLSGSDQTIFAGCSAKDLDGDGDVDLSDFSRLQRCLSGPNVPVNPNCPN